LKKQGIKERIVKVEQAPGLPLDYGGFEIVEEPFETGVDPDPKKGRALLRVVA
jgi:hypothetical protein